MRTIYKYDLPQLPGIHTKNLPPGRVLSVGLAYNSKGRMAPVMWAEVNPDAGERQIEIMVAWTGQPMPAEPSTDWRFIGTVVYDEGHMVQHVYVREPS
jgi:hypothetical protein